MPRTAGGFFEISRISSSKRDDLFRIRIMERPNPDTLEASVLVDAEFEPADLALALSGLGRRTCKLLLHREDE